MTALTPDAVKKIPKVELHAHLGGSVRLDTLKELMAAKGLEGLDFTVGEKKVGEGTDSDRMQKCFEIFDAIYKVTDNLSVIQRITSEVIVDYAEENTAYLELRTSLKRFGTNTEADYLETVLAAVEQANAGLPDSKKVPTTILVSINRGRTVEEAQVAVDTAIAYMGKGVVGIDFSGNCYKGTWSQFLPMLQKARAAGLKISVHAGEKDDPVELKEMLAFRPDRIGHFVFSDEESEQRVREESIPIEMCITSNLVTSNWHPAEHHLINWIDHPISINTDDRGVFSVSLTSEYLLASQTFDLTLDQLTAIAKESLRHSFLDEEKKTMLMKSNFGTDK